MTTVLVKGPKSHEYVRIENGYIHYYCGSKTQVDPGVYHLPSVNY